MLDGVPGDPARPGATAIKLSGTDGALVIGEVNYLRGGTKAAIGAWTYTARFDAIPAPGAPASGQGNAGAYVFVEHRLKGTRADDADGLAGWLRFGIADTRYNAVASYLGGGLVYAGPLPARKADLVGLSFAMANFSDRYRLAQSLAGRPTDARELIVEAGYLVAAAPWLSIQPDVQFVMSPGGDARIGNAVVAGLRVKIGR